MMGNSFGMGSEKSGTDSDIVFRDLILLMLTGFVIVAVLMLGHINPKAAAALAAK
jgi:hypothetical protein